MFKPSSPMSSPPLIWPALALMAAVAAGIGCSRDDPGLVHVDRIDDKSPSIRETGWLKNGKKHGRWLTFMSGVLTFGIHYDHGIRHGLSASYSESGVLGSDWWWERGEAHGRSRSFTEDGQRLMELGWYRRDWKVGIWCYWHADTGVLEKMEDYGPDHSTFIEIEYPPGECPLTVGYGKRHMDPNNREYSWRYARPTFTGRSTLRLR